MKCCKVAICLLSPDLPGKGNKFSIRYDFGRLVQGFSSRKKKSTKRNEEEGESERKAEVSVFF